MATLIPHIFTEFKTHDVTANLVLDASVDGKYWLKLESEKHIVELVEFNQDSNIADVVESSDANIYKDEEGTKYIHLIIGKHEVFVGSRYLKDKGITVLEIRRVVHNNGTDNMPTESRYNLILLVGDDMIMVPQSSDPLKLITE